MPEQINPAPKPENPSWIPSLDEIKAYLREFFMGKQEDQSPNRGILNRGERNQMDQLDQDQSALPPKNNAAILAAMQNRYGRGPLG
jgi:hypothetical protein